MYAFGVRHLHRVDVAMLDGAVGGGLDVVFDQRAGGDAAGVERTHRELRARLTDRLSADDADRQAFFDQPGWWTYRCRSSGRRRRAGFRR